MSNTTNTQLLGALPPSPRSFSHWGNQEGQRELGAGAKSCPSVIPLPRRSGCSPAEPCPPGRQTKSNYCQRTKEREQLTISNCYPCPRTPVTPLSGLFTLYERGGKPRFRLSRLCRNSGIHLKFRLSRVLPPPFLKGDRGGF
jgi:hypothetical protein